MNNYSKEDIEGEVTDTTLERDLPPKASSQEDVLLRGRQASEQGGPQQASKQGGPQQASKQGGPQQASKQGGPQQTSKQGGPQQASKQGGPQQTSKQGGPQQTSKQGGPQQTSKQGGPQQASKQGGPQQTSKQGGPQQASKQGGPQQASKQGGPQQASKQGGSQQASKQGGPQQASKQGNLPEMVRGKMKEGSEKNVRLGLNPKRAYSAPSKVKASKQAIVSSSQGEDLSRQLILESYECMICYNNIRKDQSVWSCNSCYHIFHLPCIKRWARQMRSQQEIVKAIKDSWHCPACRQVCTEIPTVYYCFCGGVANPSHKGVAQYYVPHSCGKLCQKPLRTSLSPSCKHTCMVPCHPGPCPQCPAMIYGKCPCGKKRQQVRCGSGVEVPSCGEPCYRIMRCGKHRCLFPCHSGDCSSCQVSVEKVCHCGRQKKCFTCESWNCLREGDKEETALSCRQSCSKILLCGNHRCERVCHSGDCPPCPLLPDLRGVCPCGKTSLASLGITRESCLDDIPTCDLICGKLLSCGNANHICMSRCHHGDCPECTGDQKILCRCKQTTAVVSCSEARVKSIFLCDKICSKKKTCGRHRCSRRCCDDTSHVCDLICGKTLQCGKHTCTQLCHKGYCDQCWEYSYDELFCDCGKEVILPPIACGTPPPLCSRPCSRVHPCNHPVYHNCHMDEKCPPCSVMSEKICNGEHKECRVPCFLDDVSCGRQCGRNLPCGHKCNRICHKGACLPEGEACRQLCTLSRPVCGHPCAAPCHPNRPCPDEICKAVIIVKCECGRNEQQMLCMTTTRKGILGDVVRSSDFGALIAQLASGQNISLEKLEKVITIHPDERRLECDEVCAVMDRNRKLAEALNIESPEYSSEASETNYSDFLCQMARGSHGPFVRDVEEVIRQLVENAKKKGSVQKHMFRPMSSEKRQAVHELAEVYGCDSQSFDEEPFRSVAVFSTSKSHVSNVRLVQYAALQKTLPTKGLSHRDKENSGRKSPKDRSLDYFDGDF